MPPAGKCTVAQQKGINSRSLGHARYVDQDIVPFEAAAALRPTAAPACMLPAEKCLIMQVCSVRTKDDGMSNV
jgi:hypothetical protein